MRKLEPPNVMGCVIACVEVVFGVKSMSVVTEIAKLHKMMPMQFLFLLW